MTCRKRALGGALSVFTLLIAFCATAPARAVTGGTADGDDHPFVAMVIPPGASSPACTGTLVTGDNGAAVVLTDAHCLYRNGRRTGTGVQVSFDSTWTSSSTVYSGTFYIHPHYQPPSTLHDLAAIIVFGTVPTPATLAPVDFVPTMSDTSTLTVGIGRTYWGQRRAATENVTSSDASWLYLAAGDGNSCDGDSGGPDIAASTGAVVALTDQGSCSYDQDTRLDTADGHWFTTAAPTWRTMSPRLSFALSSYTVRRGTTVGAYGSTSGLYSGETIYRQGYYNGAWHTWASTVVSAAGSYRFSVTPTVAGTDYYRLYLPRTATHPGAVSATLTLHVR